MYQSRSRFGFVTFHNFDGCYVYLLKSLLMFGSEVPDRSCRQLLGVAYQIMKPRVREELIESLGIPMEWLSHELEERLSRKPINPGMAWEKWSEVFGPRLHSGRFSYTNAERMYYQLDKIVSLLKTNPSTRRAILCIWNPSLDTISEFEVPSTIACQYFVRGSFLDATCYSRSSDCIRFLPADFYLYAAVQKWIADQINREQGALSHVVSALYISKQDQEFAEVVLQQLLDYIGKQSK